MSVLGVDLGGTNLRAAAAGVDGAILSERSERPHGLTPAAFAARVRQLADELSSTPPDAIAVGLPGPVSAEGEVGEVVNAPVLSGAPVRALLREEFDAPVIVENDVNLAALGEHRRGRGHGVDGLVFIAVGTGVGMGIVAGGTIVRGAHGGAGELGLLPLGPHHVPRHLGQLGPLEGVAAGAGLAARWTEHTERRSSAKDVFSAALAGDRAALELLDAQAAALAMAVRAVQALLDPELIVFGGGIGARHDVFARVQAALARHGFPLPALEQSALGERAGLIGAIEAALDSAPTATTLTTGRNH